MMGKQQKVNHKGKTKGEYSNPYASGVKKYSTKRKKDGQNG